MRNIDLDNKLKTLFAGWKSSIPRFIQEYKGVMVACSGGLDSTALFLLLQQFTKSEKNFALAISHVDYGLRGEESTLDAEFVQRLANDFSVPLVLHRASRIDGEQRNVQLWARQVRYQHWAECAQQGWLVAIAHHHDDLAENVLLRLARGSSCQSLLGMTEWRPPFWRPLLGLNKAEMTAWLTRQHLPFRHDSSNDKLVYNRNRIRHCVIPELESSFPGAKERIVRCAEEARDLAAFVIEQFRTEIAAAQTAGLPTENLRRQNRAVIITVLSAIIGRRKERGYLTHRLLDQLTDAVQLGHNTVIDLPGGGQISLHRGVLHLLPASIRDDESRPSLQEKRSTPRAEPRRGLGNQCQSEGYQVSSGGYVGPKRALTANEKSRS